MYDRPINFNCESLEGRQLLAGFEAHFNFQPNGTTPSGYTADLGQKYSTQNGLTYGWDKNNSRFVTDRHTTAKQRYDTLAFMGIGDSATSWQVAVPDGLYQVQILAGDAKYTNSIYAFDAEGTEVLRSKPTRANPWRKGVALVWVSDGKLTIDAAEGAKNLKIDSVDIQQMDPHVTGTDIVNPFALTGIVQNEVSDDVAMPAIQTLGFKSVRLWYPIRHWTDSPTSKFLKLFKKYHDAGYTVTGAFATSEVPEPDVAKAFFTRLAADPSTRANVDFWEIGNEPNTSVFWKGTEAQFVDDYMAPAYEVLHAYDEPVIGGGVSYDTNYAYRLEQAGYSNYCDYAGFHPYGESGAIVIQRAATAKAIFGKPLIITEWNVQFVSDLTTWANEVAIAAAGLAKIAYLNYYYALGVDDTHVGAGGLIDHTDGTPNTLFYDVAETWNP